MLLAEPLIVCDPDAEAGSRPVAQLSLLGGFHLQVDGVVLELPQTAQRLIAFLALRRSALTRVFVAGSLWTDAGESQACSSLRSVLWRLRARTPVICATSTHLSLVPWLQIDVADCSELARRVQAGDCSPAPGDVIALSDAGELLPDWYDDWLVVERERVRQRRLHALEAACARLTTEGRYADALEAGLAAVAMEPLRETGHAVVISAHLAEGNLVEASRQYDQLRSGLRAHLGADPSARVRRLVLDGRLVAA